MRFLNRLLLYNPLKFASTASHLPSSFRLFSAAGENAGGGDGDGWSKNFKPLGDDLGWGDSTSSTWTTGLTKEHFDGQVVGRKINPSEETPAQPQSGVSSTSQFTNARWTDNEIDVLMKTMDEENKKAKAFVDGWGERMKETKVLLKQVREPGSRGSYLKDSEKAEMYKLHKENPQVYTVEKLAKDYRIMRQRVHAILWLKEDEEEVEKKLGHPLDNAVEMLLDNTHQLYTCNDREFHVASLPYKPDFKVMPEGWDGTTKDPDEVHYEISKKEDEILYQEFVLRFNFNKLKMANKIKGHKYSRRRPNDGWNFTVEKMGPRGKRGKGGGWKFVSLADGSSRPLNELEKMFLKRETPRRRRRVFSYMK